MKTKFQSVKQAKEDSKWLIVDATSKPLGRLASKVAALLRGKHNPNYTKHQNGGDFVIVINAKNVKLTGKKLEQKIYYDYSGYIGGLRERTAKDLLSTNPELIIKRAVKGMLPSGALSHKVIKKLKVYAGVEHPHQPQNPQVLELSL